MYVPTATNRRVHVELVGQDKIPGLSDTSKLRQAALIGMDISDLVRAASGIQVVYCVFCLSTNH